MTHVMVDRVALLEACDRARARGLRVGLVPTMGALHAGHLSLIDAARRHGADFVVVTIFVNPTQFGPNEDFRRYPRTLDDDLNRCRERGVDVVFTPSVQEMYPEGFSTSVEVSGLTAHLEGAHRPGHFRGVTTIVSKLFAAASPCLAVFGRKDYQQWKVIERMARDLDMRVDVFGEETVREHDGLALSSRNQYLSPSERQRARGIHKGLVEAIAAFDGGERDASRLVARVGAEVQRAFDSIDYVAAAHPETLEPVEGNVGDRVLIAVAGRLGTTRLIDNVVLEGPRRLISSG